MAKETLESRFDQETGADTQILDEARRCSELSKPWLLPYPHQRGDQSLPQNFQSMGSRGLTSSSGAVVQATFPIDTPWYHIIPKASVRYGRVDPDELAETEQDLFIRSLLGQAMLEAAGSPADGRMPISLRMAKLMSVNQALGTGDSLERLDDHYRITVYRRDKYVTRRGTDAQVLFHMTRESIDPLGLPEKAFKKTGLDMEKEKEKPSSERMKNLTTLVEYQPWTRTWVIRQELNKKKIVESQEPCCPYFATPYELVAGEHYGRGLIELNKGDLRSYDELMERLLDAAAAASKLVPVIDPASELTPDDLMKRSGVPVMDRVSNGLPANIAYLQLNKNADLAYAAKVAEMLRSDLGAALLIQSEMVRDSERTTKFEVQEVTIRELQNRLTGFLAVHEHQAGPLARRVDYQLERDKLVMPLKKKNVEVRILTGLSALTHAAKAAKLLTLVEVFQKFGDTQIQRLNLDDIADAWLRYQGIYEPYAIKPDEQVKAEREAALQEAIRAAAAEKTVDVIGNAAEAKLTAA